MSRAHRTHLSLEIEVKYTVLPAEDDLPRQIDITGVFSVQSDPDASRVKRRANILPSLSESEIISLEDEIEETRDDQ